jgi:CRP-like cAMP-binding protein
MDGLARLFAGPKGIRRITAGSSIINPSDGGNGSVIGLIINGWAFSYKLLTDGRRQIVKIELAGGVIGAGMPSLDGAAVLGCEALTEVLCYLVPRDVFWMQASTNVQLAWLAAVEMAQNENLLRHRLADVAKRSACERIANLLCELYCRSSVNIRGERRTGKFRIPLTQTQIADTVGLTPIHVSRSLRILKSAGILAYSGRQLEVVDADGLRRMCSLEPEYMRWLETLSATRPNMGPPTSSTWSTTRRPTYDPGRDVTFHAAGSQ